MSYSALNTKKVLDVVKYRWVWIIVTTILLLPGIIAMIYSSIVYPNHSPLLVGIDFTGGTIVQYAVDKDVSTKDIEEQSLKMAKYHVICENCGHIYTYNRMCQTLKSVKEGRKMAKCACGSHNLTFKQNR